MNFSVGEMVKYETKGVLQKGVIKHLLSDQAVVDWLTVTYKDTNRTISLNRTFNVGYKELESLEIKEEDYELCKCYLMMHLAVNDGDKDTFYKLAAKVNELKERLS